MMKERQMSRKSKSVALYVVRVWLKEPRFDNLPLVSNFTKEGEAWDFYQTVKSLPEVAKLDMSPGYMVFKTAEEALENFSMWVR
jgi:hypothetical protein